MKAMVDMKRIFDLLVSILGLIAAAPLMCILAVLIKLESKGPVFYSCVRAGRGRKPFGMLKFRTMVENADNVDCTLCPAGDVRVTRFGHLLRRTKLNELPQLFNVIVGQMSMVGPRPEDPKLLKYYPDKWQTVLSVRPGVVGINQIVNRNEEDMFPPEVKPEEYYVDCILPEKLERDLAYVCHRSFVGDLTLLCRAVYHTLFKGLAIRDLLRKRRTLQLILVDVVCSLLAYLAANVVRFEALPTEAYIWKHFAIIALINPLVFCAMGVYRSSIRFFSIPDLLLVIRASCVAGIMLICLSYFLMFGAAHSRVVFAAYPVFLLLGISSARIAARQLWERKELGNGVNGEKVRVIIYGAGRLGTETLRRIRFHSEMEVVGFVDDNESIRGQNVMGVSVLGSGRDLLFLKSLCNVRQVMIAFNSAGEPTAEAGRRCVDAGLEYVLAPSIGWNFSAPYPKKSSSLYKFANTLEIHPITLDSDAITSVVQGATIAIVGAGDAFGEALCLELAKLGPHRLVLVEDCEPRFARIGGFASDVEGSGVSLLPYLVPLGSPVDWIEETFVSLGVKWIVYNRPNRPIAQAALNKSRTYESHLRDALLFLELARRCGCQGFSFLSPYGKECFSHEEKELFLFIEKFLRVSSNTGPGSLRSSVIRIPNILENDCEILATSINRISEDRVVQAHGLPLAFISAQSAARAFLNSLSAHHRGETYVVKPGLEAALSLLIEQFFDNEGDGHRVAHLLRPVPVEETNSAPRKCEWVETLADTVYPGLSKVVEAGAEDANFLNQRFEEFISPGKSTESVTKDYELCAQAVPGMR